MKDFGGQGNLPSTKTRYKPSQWQLEMKNLRARKLKAEIREGYPIGEQSKKNRRYASSKKKRFKVKDNGYWTCGNMNS